MSILQKVLFNTRVAETSTVANQIVAKFDATDFTTDLHITSIIDELRVKADLLKIALTNLKSESVLADKDGIRDDSSNALISLVSGYCYHPDIIINVSAKKVYQVFEKFGANITRENYATESGVLNSIITQIKSDEFRSDIMNLPGVNQLIDELNTAQVNFENSRLEYNDEKAADSNKESASEIKKSVLDIINTKFIAYLKVMASLDSAKYGLFADTIAEIVDDNNKVVKQR